MVRSGPTRSEKYTGPEHYYNSYAITPQSLEEVLQDPCKLRILPAKEATDGKIAINVVYQTHGVDYYSVKVDRSHLLQANVVLYVSFQSRDPHFDCTCCQGDSP